MKKKEEKTTKLELKKVTIAKLNNMNMIKGGGNDGDNTDTIWTKVDKPKK